jgi:hypothetical protein
VHYGDLGKAVGLDAGLSGYPDKPLKVNAEGQYERALRSRSPKDILVFLKEWNKRVKIDLKKLRQAILNSEPILRRLRKRSILSVKLNDNINVNGEAKPLHDVIVELFEIFSKVSKARKNYKGSSKILHVLVPELFVMWDDTIRCAYGCRVMSEAEAGEKYFKFLKRVQRVAKEVIDSYRTEHNCGVNEAVKRIRRNLYEEGFYTLARLVDQYNFQKYTKGKDELW